MGFVLQEAGNPTDEVRRVLEEQLAQAREALELAGGGDEQLRTGVHEARKACKRLRATFRLAGVSKTWRVRARDAARPIGPVRDAHVLQTLAPRFGVPGPTPPDDTDDRVRVARGLLDEVRVDVPDLHWDALVEQYAAGVGTVQLRFDRAVRSGTVDAVHDLRKAVKVHGYQSQLLRHRVDDARIAQLDVLQALLGDFNDLSVLRPLVPAEVQPQLDARRERLWADARPRLEALLAPGATARFG